MRDKKNITDTGAELLIQAIIKRACIDYVHPIDDHMKYECELFFKSDWFEELTDLDPERILNILNNGRIF